MPDRAAPAAEEKESADRKSRYGQRPIPIPWRKTIGRSREDGGCGRR